ncbi:MAG: tyrosine-type recombinase/integrase [Clostridiales bacterium]|nr:tyrosine-type recombinase/integrase [Candidatus Crickella caballi]
MMKDFIEYLKNEKHKAENTLIAYERDIKGFEQFLTERRGKTLADCAESDAIAYVLSMGKENKSKATINRKVSALRTYCDFLIGQSVLDTNPFAGIKSGKSDKREIDYLTLEDVEALLALPSDDRKGLRDKALMEFMYGTGARVTEVVRLRIEDVNLRMSFVTLRDVNDESRIVPLGRYAREALVEYLEGTYDSMKGSEKKGEDYVFINLRGEQLTRQGIWKILKNYGEKLGLAERMTPQILRDSFAVHILKNGGDLKSLQELMGFEDMSIGIAYLAVTDIHVRDVFKRCHPRA